jgi:hypothetical protein
MMNGAKVLLAAALLVGSASACSDLNGNNVAADGQFSLVRVSNSTGSTSIPYQYVDQTTGHTIFVQSDTFVLTSNGSYQETQVYQDNGFQAVANETGSWSQSNNTVFFTPDLNSDFGTTPYQGTIRNDGSFNGSRTLTISIGGTTAIYTD